MTHASNATVANSDWQITVDLHIAIVNKPTVTTQRIKLVTVTASLDNLTNVVYSSINTDAINENFKYLGDCNACVNTLIRAQLQNACLNLIAVGNVCNRTPGLPYPLKSIVKIEINLGDVSIALDGNLSIEPNVE
jgi:hypothetical protein